MMNLNPRRGLIAARADAGAPSMADLLASLNTVNTAFAEFKATNEKRLAEIEARGTADPVTTEKLAKLEKDISAHQATLDAHARQAAANVIMGGGAPGLTPEALQRREHFAGALRNNSASIAALRPQAGAAVSDGPTGGFLVPTEMDTAIVRTLGATVAMRGLAAVRTIGGAAFTFPRSVGGAAGGWTGEKDARTETAGPALKEIEIRAEELYAMPLATQTLIDDAGIDIATWYQGEVEITFAEKEADAFINGDGVKKPMGLLSYTKVANASYAWGKIGFVVSGAAAGLGPTPSASATQADGLISLVYALKAGYRQNAQFLMADGTLAEVRKLRDADGNPIWQPSLQVGQPSLLMGYAVASDDGMPAVGANAYPIAFGDFSRAYMIVDRAGIRVVRDELTARPYVGFYTTKRVGGGVQNFEAVKLLKCST